MAGLEWVSTARLNLKQATEALQSGATVICQKDLKRIHMERDQITVNNTPFTIPEFIERYADEVFHNADSVPEFGMPVEYGKRRHKY